MEHTVYEAVGGRQAIIDLAHAWHRRCLDDPVVSHAFSHPGQHPDHIHRLAAYWIEQLGGPAEYTSWMADHSHVVALHSGNGDHAEMDRRGIDCFLQALDDAGVPDDPQLRQALQDWFTHMTAQMSAYPDAVSDVPADLPMPYWTFRGLDT